MRVYRNLVFKLKERAERPEMRPPHDFQVVALDYDFIVGEGCLVHKCHFFLSFVGFYLCASIPEWRRCLPLQQGWPPNLLLTLITSSTSA